jgi:hypothetical protein
MEMLGRLFERPGGVDKDSWRNDVQRLDNLRRC